MSSITFCSKFGKNEVEISEFTNQNGDTICKECWNVENDNNNKDNKK